jgi:hypothetical protein
MGCLFSQFVFLTTKICIEVVFYKFAGLSPLFIVSMKYQNIVFKAVIGYLLIFGALIGQT